MKKQIRTQIRTWMGLGTVAIAVALGEMALGEAALATTKVAQSGAVRAELSYQIKTEDGFNRFSDLRIKIQRSNQTVLDAPIKDTEYDRPMVNSESKYFQVVDLDGDREPEVVVDLFTGGAHCCLYSRIYRYDAKTQQYKDQRYEWQHTGYGLEDLDKDGLPEFRSFDNSFAYRFSSFAGSGMPLQIWQYRQGKMVDVTRRYPKLLRAHAFDLWKYYNEAKRQDYEVKGMLAPYVATKCLLGQGKDGWQRVQQVYQADDRQAFFADLRQFLREGGYSCDR